MADYKIVIIGEGGVGKTALCERVCRGVFEPRYLATLGMVVHPVKLHTSAGEFTLQLCDTAGQEKFAGLREGYFTGADAAILLCDLTSFYTNKRASDWATRFRVVCPNAPIVTVANKTDREPDPRMLGDVLPIVSDCSISVKTGENIMEPFLQVLRELTGDPSLSLQPELVN